ncbi:GNAT family N-acetyltransferase [Streptomyces sp. NBC_01410]|uniref:GNAT family N-acetyltransferase n=1 Tax=Streptomyces sp. NBC_01410 TaxID=2903856 RepID=UPI003867EDD9
MGRLGWGAGVVRADGWCERGCVPGIGDVPGWLGRGGGSRWIGDRDRAQRERRHDGARRTDGAAGRGCCGCRSVREVLPVARVLGPAVLSYLSPECFRPVAASSTVEQLPVHHPALRSLEKAAGHEDAAEASLDEITSPVFVVREHGKVVAAAGYQAWRRWTAHISVLTAPDVRGRGLARVTGSATVAHALAAGLLPQWRARPPASRRVAAASAAKEMA